MPSECKTRCGKRHRHTVNPAGTKLIKRFIRQATGENTTYRRDLDVIERISIKAHEQHKEGKLRTAVVATLLRSVYERAERMKAA